MTQGFFPAVEPAGAAYFLLQQLWPSVRAEAELHGDVDVWVHAELRVGLSAGGDVERRRFYWSTQHRDSRSPLGFSARTLYCRATGARQVYAFPAEPVLTWLDDADGPLRSDGQVPRVEILRYVPLRRLTFRLHDGAGLPGSVIAKVKRTGGLNRAVNAFLAVHQAAARSRSGVPRVPQLLRLEPPGHVLYLEELPGETLDVAIGSLPLAEAVEQLGQLHRSLQELDVRGLPKRLGTRDWLQGARHAATQIGWFVPSVARQAEAVYAELARSAPEGGRLLFCQGDFLPGQILCDPSGWSVIDFDDSRYADPLSEVAALYAVLPRELGLAGDLGELARRTYLEAYARRAVERFDRTRWHWFLVLVQLTGLAKRLIKGRAAPDEAGSVLDRLTAPADGTRC